MVQSTPPHNPLHPNHVFWQVQEHIRLHRLDLARSTAFHQAIALSKSGQPENGLALFDRCFELIRQPSEGKPDIVELWKVKGILYSLIAQAYSGRRWLELLEVSTDSFEIACDLTRRKRGIYGFRFSRQVTQCMLYSRLGASYRVRAQRKVVSAKAQNMAADQSQGVPEEEDSEILRSELDDGNQSAGDLRAEDNNHTACPAGDESTEGQAMLEQALIAYQKAIDVGEEAGQQFRSRSSKTKSRAQVEAKMYLVRAYIGRVMVLAQQVKLGYAGKVTTAQHALADLKTGVERFSEMLWLPGFDWSLHPGLFRYGKLRRFYVNQALGSGPGGQPRFELLQDQAPKLAYLLLWQLANWHWHVGDIGLAGWLLSWADEYLPEDERNPQLQVERGTLEQDINILFALDRLERLVSTMAFSPDAKLYSPVIRRSLVHSILQLANLLRSIGAESEVSLYLERGLDLIADDPTNGARGLRTRLQTLSAAKEIIELDTYSQEETDQARTETNVEPSQTSKLLGDRCDRLDVARRQEDAYAVATHLWLLSAQLAHVQSADISSELGARIARTVALVDDWKLKNRTQHVVGEVPRGWGQDTLAAAACYARLAWEFADNFRAGSAHRVIGTLVQIETMRQGGHTEETVALWEEVAKSAARVWHWRHAALWALKVARWRLENGDRDTAIMWASEASNKIAVGLDRLRFGADKADVVRKHYKGLVEAARILAHARAEPQRIFEAFERCKGNMTIAARYRLRRRALTANGQSLENALWRLSGLELRLAQEADYLRQQADQVKEPAGSEILERLKEIQDTLRECREKRDAIWPKLAQESPESVQRLRNVFSLGKLEDTLNIQQVGPIAVIEYLCDDSGDIWGVASKTDGGSRLTYNLPAKQPLASKTLVLGKSQALIDSLAATISSGVAALSRGPTSAQDYRMKSLYEALIAPFADFIRGSSALYIIPHDELASLPYSAFRADNGSYLVQMYDVAELTSLNLWLNLLHVPVFSGNGLLGLGWDQAIRAPQELSFLRESLKDQLGTNRLALPCDVDSGVSQLLLPDMWTVIHVAAHGEWQPGMGSAILFPGNRKVTAERILQGCGRAQLVVLNCCWAGRSSFQAGDLYGFPFALTSTGSLSTILPIIPVCSEAARHFANRFYGELACPKMPKLRAFSNTIRAMIGDEHWRHPAAWAPYTFVGHPGPMVWRENNEPSPMDPVKPRGV